MALTAVTDGAAVAAQIESAQRLLFGIDAEPQPLQAIAQLIRGEAGGSVDAGILLAQIAAGDTLVALDVVASQRLLRGVELRKPLALRAAALVFARMSGDSAQRMATQLLRAAAKRGDPLSAQLLAERVIGGVGCESDPAAAQALWTQLSQSGVPRLPRIGVVRPVAGHGADVHTAPALDLLAYVRATTLSPLASRPKVGVSRNLLNADECALLIAAATPLLRPSLTIDPATGQPLALQLRTSHDAQFDVVHEDLALRLVQARMAAAAGLALDQAEHLIVLRYEPGQEYRPHRDYLSPEAIARDRPHAGNRLRSICAYLNDVEAGGATEFPHARLTIEPRAGDAIVFDNLLPDGSPDTESLHAGLPVERGVKWLATLWFRQRPYRYF